MSNRNEFYLAIPQASGNIVLAKFDKTRYDPHRTPVENMGSAVFVDMLPITDAIELGCSIQMAGVQAMQDYGRRVRQATISRAVKEASGVPYDPSELSKMSAFFEGLDLDPNVSISQVQDALVKKEQQEEQENAS